MCWERSNDEDDRFMKRVFLKKKNQLLLKSSSFSIRRYRTSEKLYKLFWSFHLTDADYWPCVPHGHNDEKGLKLDIITGEVFSVTTRKCVGSVTAKELQKLNANRRFRNFVYQHVSWYRQTYPNTNIRCPEWVNQSRISASRCERRAVSKTYVYCIVTHLE